MLLSLEIFFACSCYSLLLCSNGIYSDLAQPAGTRKPTAIEISARFVLRDKHEEAT